MKLTRRQRAAGRMRGPAPSGYATPADRERTAHEAAAEERTRAERARRNAERRERPVARGDARGHLFLLSAAALFGRWP